MRKLVVSQNPRRGFTNLTDALTGPDVGPMRIVVEPGQYRMTSCRFWSVAEIEAKGGPNTVVIDCGGIYNLQVEGWGRVVLRGLTLRNYHEDGAAVNVTRGQLAAEDCAFSSITDTAVQAWDGARLFLHRSVVRGGGIGCTDAEGVIDASTVDESASDGVALRRGSRFKLRNVAVRKAGRFGIWADGGSAPHIEGCRVEEPASAGIVIEGKATAAVVGTRVTGTGEAGLIVRANATATVGDSAVSGSGDVGVWVTARGNLTAQRLSVESAGISAVYVSDNATATLGQCRIEASKMGGIVVDGESTITVADTRISRTGGDGLVVTDAHATVEDTVIHGAGGAGISVVKPAGLLTARRVAVEDAANNGILVYGRSAIAELVDCVIVRNKQGDGLGVTGAGMCSFSGGSIADSNGGGASVSGVGSALTLHGTRVTGNKFSGAVATQSGELVLRDCTITDNEGSGILATVDSRVSVNRTVSHDNERDDMLDVVLSDDNEGEPESAPTKTAAPAAHDDPSTTQPEPAPEAAEPTSTPRPPKPSPCPRRRGVRRPPSGRRAWTGCWPSWTRWSGWPRSSRRSTSW